MPIPPSLYEVKQTPQGFASIKDVDTQTNTVTGYFAAFLNADADGERFAEDAFDQTIAERGPNAERTRIKHLYQHRPQNLIGEPEVLRTDEHGLYFETPIVDTRLGTDVLKLYSEGVLSEHSVGFIRRGEEDLDDGTTLITKVELFEGSAVTWGANPATPVTGVKSFETPQDAIKDLSETASNLRSVLKEGLTDARAEQVEIGLRQIEAALHELRSQFGDEEEGQPSSGVEQLHIHIENAETVHNGPPEGKEDDGTPLADEKSDDPDDPDDPEDPEVSVKMPDVNLFALDEDDPSNSPTSTFFPSDD